MLRRLFCAGVEDVCWGLSLSDWWQAIWWVAVTQVQRG